MDRARQLLIDVVLHLVTGGAEFFGVGDLECRIEGPPEHHATDEAAERQKPEAQRARRRADKPPRPQDKFSDPLHGLTRFRPA
ncbi:hypothetical protein D3C71_1836890 [compost metagenome]